MALFEETTAMPQSEAVQPIKLKAVSESYKGIAIDTKYIPKSSMLEWINGSNWRVTYFSQVLDETQEPTPLALSREPAYQQYRKIVNMDLKVNQTLDISQDARIKTFSVTGSGHTYPFLTPNLGDMFIGNIGDGTLGLFVLTASTRETFLRDSTYAVEWKMVSKLTDAQAADLEKKTIITYYYSPGSLMGGCGPFVTEQEDQDNSDNRKLLRDLINRYISDFYSPEHATFLVPDQLMKTYDHFLTKFMTRIIGVAEFPKMRNVKTLNVMSEPVMRRNTFWDTLLERDVSAMCYSTQRVHLVSTKISRWRPELQAIGYTGIPRFIYPLEVPYDVDSAYDSENLFRPEGLPFHEGRSRVPMLRYKTQLERNLKWFQANTDPAAELWDKAPDIHPVSIDDYYVLSESYYLGVGYKHSKLESLVAQLLDKETLNPNVLRAVLKCCLDWDNLERFYYHPILIALIKYTIR